MKECYEFAIFKVAEENKAKAIELSLAVFKEINAKDTLILSHEVFEKLESSDEICWKLTWANEDAVKVSNKNWPTYASSKALESIVGEKIYYGHFNRVI